MSATPHVCMFGLCICGKESIWQIDRYRGRCLAGSQTDTPSICVCVCSQNLQRTRRMNIHTHTESNINARDLSERFTSPPLTPTADTLCPPQTPDRPPLRYRSQGQRLSWISHPISWDSSHQLEFSVRFSLELWSSYGKSKSCLGNICKKGNPMIYIKINVLK